MTSLYRGSLSFVLVRYSATSSRINEAIFFVVTNLEHEVVNNSVIPSSEDNYLGSTVGELGCWIDSAITRVIQTGLEHSRIPDVVAYMGLGQSLFPLASLRPP